MPPILGIGIAGALGALARYGLGRAMVGLSSGFPWGTFTVNMLGCLAIAVAGAIALRYAGVAPLLRIEVMTGFIGAFTTFSTFCLETLELARSNLPQALAYLSGSTAVGLVAVWIGARLGGGL